MDFAGGTPVHIASGTTEAAFAIFYAIDTKGWDGAWNDFVTVLRKCYRGIKGTFSKLREDRVRIGGGDNYELDGPALPATDGENPPNDDYNENPPHDVNNIVLGTALLWIGWLGFNGGSALGINLRAVVACISTHIAACAGGSTSLLLVWAWNAKYRNFQRKSTGPTAPFQADSTSAFCDGAIAGLVAITPGAGFVPVSFSAVFGVVSAATVLLLKTQTKDLLADKPLYIFAIHTGGGMVGMFLTGCFASQAIVGLDGRSAIPDRRLSERLSWQMFDAFMGFFYSLVVTLAILFFLKLAKYVLTRNAKLLVSESQQKKWRLRATLRQEWQQPTTTMGHNRVQNDPPA